MSDYWRNRNAEMKLAAAFEHHSLGGKEREEEEE